MLICSVNEWIVKFRVQSKQLVDEHQRHRVQGFEIKDDEIYWAGNKLQDQKNELYNLSLWQITLSSVDN